MVFYEHRTGTIFGTMRGELGDFKFTQTRDKFEEVNIRIEENLYANPPHPASERSYLISPSSDLDVQSR